MTENFVNKMLSAGAKKSKRITIGGADAIVSGIINKLSEKTYKEFVMSLDISDESKDKLSKLTPHTYTGIASNLAK